MIRFLMGVMILCGAFVSDMARAESEATRLAREALEIATRNLEKYRGLAEEIHGDVQNFDSLTGQLPPEIARELEGFGGRQPSLQERETRLLVFVTLDMPDASLKAIFADVKRAGGVALVRGFYKNKLSATVARLQELGDGKESASVQINSTAFKQFDVQIAPVVIVMAGPLLPCRNQGCVGDPIPGHDRIAGNLTLESALELISDEGEEARDIAEKHLGVLRGEL